MIPTETLHRWLIDITNDRPEPTGLTRAEQAVWRRIAEEVAAIKARGGVVELPAEIVGAEEDQS